MCRKYEVHVLHLATRRSPRGPRGRDDGRPDASTPDRWSPSAVPAAAGTRRQRATARHGAAAPEGPVSVEKTRSKSDGSEKFGRDYSAVAAAERHER